MRSNLPLFVHLSCLSQEAPPAEEAAPAAEEAPPAEAPAGASPSLLPSLTVPFLWEMK